jgi:methionyl-tRNA formyltransferase
LGAISKRFNGSFCGVRLKRIAFLGQKPVAVQCLKILINFLGSSSIRFVLTNLDSTGWWQNSEVSETARFHGIAVFDQDTTTEMELIELLAKNNIDTLISVQYPKIISSAVLAQVNFKAFNVHLAKLPSYRGWHAASHAILNGDRIFGVSIHKIDPEIDSGEIICESIFDIRKDITVGELYYLSEIHGINLFKKFCEKLSLGDIQGTPQVGVVRYYNKNELEIRLNSAVDEELALRASDFSYRLRKNL